LAGLEGDNPRVSAIIIFFNEERFLDEAIQSVLAQTFESWELLLCDDGSTDASTRIAIRYAEQDSRIQYLEHEGHANKGMSATRNLGLSQARGVEIAFLDGDDIWMPEKLQSQTEILDQHPQALMTFGPLLEWHSWAPGGGDDRLFSVARNGKHPFENTLVQPPEMLNLFLKAERFIPSGILIRQSACKQVGGYEDEFPASYEDAVFHVKLCATYPVYIHALPNYKYRIHPESCERQQSRRQQIENELRYLEWTRSYLQENELASNAADQAFKRALWRLNHPLLDHALKWLSERVTSTEHLAIRIGRRTMPQFARDWLWKLRNLIRP